VRIGGDSDLVVQGADVLEVEAAMSELEGRVDPRRQRQKESMH
jgi:hypothetical protein